MVVHVPVLSKGWIENESDLIEPGPLKTDTEDAAEGTEHGLGIEHLQNRENSTAYNDVDQEHVDLMRF